MCVFSFSFHQRVFSSGSMALTTIPSSSSNRKLPGGQGRGERPLEDYRSIVLEIEEYYAQRTTDEQTMRAEEAREKARIAYLEREQHAQEMEHRRKKLRDERCAQWINIKSRLYLFDMSSLCIRRRGERIHT